MTVTDLSPAAQSVWDACHEPEPTWFLLYGGTSVDGMGPGTYQGRTTNAALARRHYEQCRCDPYSCGYVMAATDRACWRLVTDGSWKGT